MKNRKHPYKVKALDHRHGKMALFIPLTLILLSLSASCSPVIHKKKGTLSRINNNCPAYDKTPTQYWNKTFHKAYK